jgi:hypothetical protein
MKTKDTCLQTIINFRLLFLLFIIPILQGCPFNSPYKIDSTPQNYVNESLMGSWQGNVIDDYGVSRVVNMNLSKKTDNEYDVYFWGSFYKKKKKYTAVQDTIYGTAYISYVANRQFMNIGVEGKYYITEFKYEQDEISLLPLAESFSSKIIKSDEQLKSAILMHYKTRLFPVYDETFCLRNMKRIKEPS